MGVELVWGLPQEETSGPETIFWPFYTWVELSAGHVLGNCSSLSFTLRQGFMKLPRLASDPWFSCLNPLG